MKYIVFEVDENGKVVLWLTGWYFNEYVRAIEFAKKMNVDYDFEKFVVLVTISGE
jgi:hypothetical protein